MVSQNKKICFFTTASLGNYGGGEKWLIAIANDLVSKGFHVQVFGTKNQRLKRKSLLEIQNYINFDYEEHESRGKFLPFMLKKIPDINCDVIYVIGGYYFFVRQILKLRGKKVYGGHDPSLLNPETFFKKRLLKSLLPKFNKVHAINKEEMKWIKYNRNTHVLENTYFGPVIPYVKKPDNFTIFFYGRHEKIKGTDTIKYIINNLDSSISFIIAGSGTESESLKTNLKNLTYLGFVNEEQLYETIRRSHAVIFPSLIEVSSLVIYEVLGNYTPLIYRNKEFNSFLEKIELCRKADTDPDFLAQIEFLYKLFEERREYYDEICSKLPAKLTNFESYMNKFIELFILSNIES